jgi:hypothetical protein
MASIPSEPWSWHIFYHAKKPGNDKIKKIVVGEEGRLSLKPLRQLDRSALAADLRRLQATMPLTLWVIQDCRAGERW